MLTFMQNFCHRQLNSTLLPRFYLMFVWLSICFLPFCIFVFFPVFVCFSWFLQLMKWFTRSTINFRISQTPHILRNSHLYNRGQKIPPVVPTRIRYILSKPYHPVSLRFILMLSSHPGLTVLRDIFPSGFPTKCQIYFFSHMLRHDSSILSSWMCLPM